jgi:hypothetical protein
MKQVTFLLFLASLAVMEYLLRKPHQKAADDTKGMDAVGGAAYDPMSAAATMPVLLALGRALDAHGRGDSPDTEQAPQVHVPRVDGV